jgi:hypothetical protein
MTSDNAGSGAMPSDNLAVFVDAVRAIGEAVNKAVAERETAAPDVVEGHVVEVVDDVDVDSIRGRTAPRLWTRPLRPLTRETSYGYRFMDWCADRAYPLDHWERWVAVHVGELLEDGRPRFRKVLIIVARQNGKTLLLKLLILWWAYEDGQRTIVMTSTNLDYARAAWAEAAEMAGAEVNMPTGVRRLEGLPAAPEIRQANGQEKLTAPTVRDPDTNDVVRYGGTFRIAAGKGDSAGRSLSIDRLVMDELRQQRDWETYNAGIHAMNAIHTSQAFLISNQGDARAVVLRSLRALALAGTDRRLGIFEYSAPEGSRADDVRALAYANPNMGSYASGRRIDTETLLGEARAAMAAGGEALAKFKTEVMCMDVPNLDPAVDPDAWRECAGAGGMGHLRTRIACCLDVDPEGRYAVLVAAAVDVDGRVVVEVVRTWESTRLLRRTLPKVVARVKPRVFGWFPGGPAAAVATDLAAPKQRRSTEWPPAGVEVKEIRTEVPAVCMGLADIVLARGLVHPNDEVINAHIGDSQRRQVGAQWIFERLSDRPICGSYATAGAVHLARLLPPPARQRRLISAK